MDNVLGNIAARTGTFVWHGKATYLDENSPVEQWATTAGMDFNIEQRELTYTFEGEQRQVDNRVALVRDDTGEQLGFVSKRYKVVQPAEIIDFFKSVCRENGFSMRTAGVLGAGEKYWALADVGAEAIFTRNHEHRAYMLLATACDGSMTTVGDLTGTCVVCENTLRMALNNGDGVKVRHSTAFSADKMKADLGIVDIDTTWEAYRETMRKLADVTNITDNQAQQFYTELLSPKRTPQDDLEGRRVRGMDKLMGAYRSAPGADPGSLYGVVQGMTRFIDHERGGAKNRMNSAWFGQGNTLKTATLNKAIELAEAA